jgi:hypothetical protein
MPRSISTTNVLKRNAEAEIANATQGSLKHALITALVDNLTGVNVETMYPWFVTCFSMCRNDLSQWRCYSGRESKFALGFELSHLYRIANSLASTKDEDGFLYRCHLAPVVYHEGRKQMLARSVLNFMVSQIQEDHDAIMPSNMEEFVQDWIVQYFAFVSVVAPMTKTGRFGESGNGGC